MKTKLIKTNTVLLRRRYSKNMYEKPKLVPVICLSGLRLRDYGFEIGKRFEVYGQNNQLVLKAKNFKYENPIIKREAEGMK
ncbi:MAG: hypothetical protein MUF15_08725 [Acidobacteria bacterium]|nr:hypothetical protein [Acidobacteriota bacterium]